MGKFGDCYFDHQGFGQPTFGVSYLAPAQSLFILPSGLADAEVGITNDLGKVLIVGGQTLNGGTTTAGLINNGKFTNTDGSALTGIVNTGAITNSAGLVTTGIVNHGAQTNDGNIIIQPGSVIAVGGSAADLTLAPIISGFGPNVALAGNNGASGHAWNIIANTTGDGNAGNLTFRDGSIGANRGGFDTSGNFYTHAAGAGVQVKEGSNCKQGTVVMNGNSLVVVSTTAVTANSRIFLTINVPGGTAGTELVAARTAGVSFSVQSANAADTSTVAWEIFEPAP